jgi:serine/threonine protein kinase
MKKLGEGAFGKVYLGKYENQFFAIKKLSKDFLMRSNKVNTVFRERDILIGNKTSPFLPKIFHTFSDEDYLYLVMEYIKDGTL